MIKRPVLFLLFILNIPANSQPLIQEQFVQRLESFYSENYQESVFIHTDKNYYLTGETIKLSVYCLNTLTEQPTGLSRVAYADVVDSKKNTILTARIELKNGVGSGEIYIPTTVPSGYVVLRGYTHWMRNFGPESFFHSVFTIINPFRKLPTLAAPNNTQPQLSFFPEGGQLIEGIPANVVFQGKTATGHPLDFTGELIDSDSTVIFGFTPSGKGMGNFQITPEAGRHYAVRMILPDSSITTHQLPKASSVGLSLQVSDKGSSFEILVNEKSHSTNSPMQILVHREATVFDAKSINNRNEATTWIVNKASLPAGVFYVSVFNDTKLISQRAVYNSATSVAAEEKIIVSASVEKRESISLNLKNLPESIANELAGASVSISQKTPEFLPTSLTMQQWILLKNAIAAPYELGAYFESRDADIAARINNLLIAYPNVKSGAISFNSIIARKFLPEARGMLVTGHIFDKVTGNPANGITAYLSIPGRNTSFFASKSKPDGSLAFELNKVYGENEVVVQTDYTKDSTYRIEIDNPYSTEYIDVTLPEFTLSESVADWLMEKSQQMQVVNAYQKYNPSKPTITEIDSSAFYFSPDASYILDDYTRFIVMEEVMREYIAGVNVRKNKDGFHFMVIDIEKNLVYEDNPLMLLDGVPVFDADEIIALDPLKIQRIQTVNRRFGKGILDCQGIVNYTTYKGNLTGYTLHPGTLTFRYDAIQIPTVSPEIKYTSATEKNSRTPDYRTTLCWIPCTSGLNMKEIPQEIFASDAGGDYELTINALTESGKVISIQDGFLVR
ncbi:MAG: hypothetical protein U5K79_20485 [Cyclobacteriaceae bacterium]|nr:hypothetical protein [Cyclobacteriaceae bacterium]